MLMDFVRVFVRRATVRVLLTDTVAALNPSLSCHGWGWELVAACLAVH